MILLFYHCMVGSSYNLKRLKPYRKNLRNNSTSAEAELWRHLKNRQLEGRKFRRQFSVHLYILDFFCPEENLCIELDGHDHFTEEGRIKDEERDTKLKLQGITVLRFENSGVWNNLQGILEEIKRHFKK